MQFIVPRSQPPKQKEALGIRDQVRNGCIRLRIVDRIVELHHHPRNSLAWVRLAIAIVVGKNQISHPHGLVETKVHRHVAISVIKVIDRSSKP